MPPSDPTKIRPDYQSLCGLSCPVRAGENPTGLPIHSLSSVDTLTQSHPHSSVSLLPALLSLPSRRFSLYPRRRRTSSGRVPILSVLHGFTASQPSVLRGVDLHPRRLLACSPSSLSTSSPVLLVVGTFLVAQVRFSALRSSPSWLPLLIC